MLGKLDMGPWDVVRRRDPAYREAGLTGGESDDELIAQMARHAGLLQRPIVVRGERAVLGRPIENVLDI